MNRRLVHGALDVLRFSEMGTLPSSVTSNRNIITFLFSKSNVSIVDTAWALKRRNFMNNQLKEARITSAVTPTQAGNCFRLLSTESFLNGIMNEEWPEHEFAAVAEASLEAISEVISDLGFNSNNSPEDFDVELSQGVLTVSLGDNGTYVLNTQTPNRQIWLSSPSSGPWRYAWNPRINHWVSTRDGHCLADRLSNELGVIFDGSVSFSFSERDP